jgi:tRNA 2-selenouridine synthase
VQNIREEYVNTPLLNHAPEFVHEKMLASVQALRNRLGGADTNELSALLSASFQRGASHEAWIEFLLRRYYDPLYEYSMRRHPRTILAKGSAGELALYLERI